MPKLAVAMLENYGRCSHGLRNRQSSPQNMSKETLSGPKAISVRGIHSTQSSSFTPSTLYVSSEIYLSVFNTPPM
ncbi:hypothetical protein D5086_031231 [Populus alba]|uniref:Uncharacterized protein n=1 Tax=Populus alba TaxID=43335 RepID=A0ACC4AQY9_POPAL